MKVYIVFDGCYSDRDAVAVFTDEAKANLFSTTLSCGDVMEFDTDEVKVEGNPEEVEWYVYAPYKDGKTANVFAYLMSAIDDTRPEPGVTETRVSLITLVKAATQEAAIKKASDRFAKYLAEKEGL